MTKQTRFWAPANALEDSGRHGGFTWAIPEQFNIARACVEEQDPRATAIVADDRALTSRVTFGDLNRLSSQVANALLGLGLRPGERVAMMLPQGAAFAAVLFGCLRAGILPVPFPIQLGPEAARARILDCEAAALVGDLLAAEKLEPLLSGIGGLQVLVIDPAGNSLDGVFGRAAGRHKTIDSRADDPALILYTSGSTGKPKGVLHAQRLLIGVDPGIRMAYGLAPKNELFWTPSDWPWALVAVLGSWLQGRAVLAAPHRRFDPEWAYALVAKHGVRLAYLTPTAMRLMKQVPRDKPLNLRVVATGGEAVAKDLHDWCADTLGSRLSSAYGLTESDATLGDFPGYWESRPGSMGRVYPGHHAEVHDEFGQPVDSGIPGELVFRLPDPTVMLEYWKSPDATADRLSGGWLKTSDEVIRDGDGYFWFQQRTDDVIKSAGYRIGPVEVEECVLKHPAVANVAVIGAPDSVRGQVVKAFVVPAPGVERSEATATDIRDFARTQLAPYQSPRVVEFVDELPLTTTGKVNRSELRRQSLGHTVQEKVP